MKLKILPLAICASAVTVAVGVFLPLASLPAYGDVTYIRIATVEACFVIAFALSAPFLIYRRRRFFVILSATGVWCTLLLPALESLYRSRTQNVVSNLADKAVSPLREFAARLFLNIVKFNWGGYVFLGGCVLFAITCVLLSAKTAAKPGRR